MKQRITTFEALGTACLRGSSVRIVRPVENWVVEQRALSNVGAPYELGADNCEHDMTFAQTGIPTSQTVITILGFSALSSVSVSLLSNQSNPRPRRRRRYMPFSCLRKSRNSACSSASRTPPV